MESLSDNALMLQVKAGQLDKLGLLFERYHKSLYGFFLRLTNDVDESEDLVQNVFVRILKYKHTFHGEGKFATWMFHMARNLFADHYKKNKRMGYKEDVEVADKYFKDENNAENNRIKDEEVDLLQQSLSHLAADKREILVLSKFQELKYKEIGEVLGLSESNVKVKIFRALKELRVIYEKLETQASIY